MTGTFSEIFGWLRGKLLSYCLIVAILLLGVWAQSEIGRMSDKEGLLGKMEKDIQKIDEELLRLRDGTDPLRKAYARTLQLQLDKEQERAAYQSSYPLLTLIPFTPEWTQLKALSAEVEVRTALAQTAGRLVSEKVQALSEARRTQVALKAEYEDNLKWARKWKELLPIFWIAAGILAFAIAAGIAIKVFLYFVIAPWASKQPPIQLLSGAKGDVRARLDAHAVLDSGKVSSVSIPISLKDDWELLVRPEYLQSTSIEAKKSTQWLLNAEIPYTCLLSGMFLLTRVRSPTSENVVVSATNDPLSEVCVVELAEQTAFVCQPRALIGVVQDPNCPVAITRHWRLGSLQSWLTLQLRFLVFHGPGQLIVAGCRGVRMEHAGTGRIINQAATLGFSANVCYANTRCETFMSYWMGKEDLFNDIFTGDLGTYIYEEMPEYKHKSGITGRGLEGVIDSGLKLFGI
jgi:hypothetical protein